MNQILVKNVFVGCIFLLGCCGFCSQVCGQMTKADSLSKLLNPEMVLVEGGNFLMGGISDTGKNSFMTPRTHRVTLSSYRIGKFEVTQVQWRAVMGINISFHQGCDDCPVEEVSWNDVQIYIDSLNKMTGRHYQLPTEAQWEFAARGGNESKRYKYSGSNFADEVAWLGGEFIDQTQPVGKKAPNELGIFDMSGNVAEWCKDWFDREFNRDPQTDPQGPSTGTCHPIRGSSWGHPPGESGVIGSGFGYPNDRSAHVGFRLVLNP